MKPVATAVAVLLLLAACAPSRSVPGYGAAGGTPTPAGAGEVPPPGLSASPTDVDFVDQAAASGLAEVEMARVATRQSSNSAVRDFATAMIADHGRMNAELDTAAFGAALEIWSKGPRPPAAVAVIARQVDALEDPDLALRLMLLLCADRDVGPEAAWARRWRALQPFVESHLIARGSTWAVGKRRHSWQLGLESTPKRITTDDQGPGDQ